MSEPTPLWTGDQVMAYTMTITNDSGKRALVRRVALELVHQYEAERAKDKQRIQELEAGYEARGKTIDAMAEDVEAMHAEIEQLRAELAETYGECIEFVASYGLGSEERYRTRYRELTGEEWSEK